MRKPSRFLLAGCATLGFTAATAFSALRSAQAQEGRLYWADAVSICEDPCPSLVYSGCRCVKLDPIIVSAN